MLPPFRASLSLLGCGSIALAQAAPIHPVPLPGVKVVAHDQGSFWPGGIVLHPNGTVTGIGGPWVGGGAHALPLTGVTDLARMDAFVPGAAERVAVIADTGLTYVRWDATAAGYELTPVDAAAAGALMVRAAPFAPHHTVVVVEAGAMSLRVYRTGMLIGTPTVSAAVRDLEIFRHDSGAARFIVRSDSAVTCITSTGAVQWSFAGHGGSLLRWPQPSATKAGWLHRETPTSPWQLTLFGDGGNIGTIALASIVDTTETLIAAFARDAEGDGDVDLVIKTSQGTSVIENQGPGDFSDLEEFQVGGLGVSATAFPDVISTHAGRRLRVVDNVLPSGVIWTRVALGYSLELEGMQLETTLQGATLVGGAAVPVAQDTRIDFRLRIWPAALAPFMGDGLHTHIQVVGWRQVEPDQGTAVDAAAEANTLFWMTTTPAPPYSEETVWPLHAQLAPEMTATDPRGWNEDTVYWLTVRVVTTSTQDLELIRASEPITLVTSMSFEQATQYGGEWGYIAPFTDGVPLPSLSPYMFLGGGVVGVVDRVVIEMPPPSGIPRPRGAATSTTTPVGGGPQ